MRVYYLHKGIPIAILFTLFLTQLAISLPINCSNYYGPDDLPSQYCNKQTNQCIFPSLTNLTEIIKETQSDEYSLCLDIPQYNISITAEVDIFTAGVYINGGSITIDKDYNFRSTSTLIMIADTVTIYDTNITGSLVWIESQQIQLQNVDVISKNDFGELCNCGSRKQVLCTPPNYYFPFLFDSQKYISEFNLNKFNYTFDTWFFQYQNVDSVVIVGHSAKVKDSKIRASAQAIYAQSFDSQNSVFNSSGLGYSSGTGPGCGYFDQVLNQLLGCTGTGASHGGYGGNSFPQNCNLLVSSPPYNFQSIPKYPGSGGGFFLSQLQEVSSGGGVINIQVDQLTVFNSSFLANGVGGIQGGGGGSGGSISVDFSTLDLTEQFNISANGGNGKSSGGGGRVRFYYHQWNQIEVLDGNQNLIIEAKGGGDCDGSLSCGQRGSVLTAPCPPGYQLDLASYTCKLCEIGRYQLSYSYQQCKECTNKPQNSLYNTPQSQHLNDYSTVCNFTCLNGSDGGQVYRLYNNKQCLNNFNYILQPVGGINLLICLGIIVTTLVIFLIIMMVRKISFNDINFEDVGQQGDFNKKKSYFKIQDIPFHQVRIYFQGRNTPNHPWHIPQYVERKISNFQEYKMYFTFLSRLFNSLNQVSRYSRSVYWLLWILKIYYYPMGIFLASKMRQNKARAVRNELIQRCRQNVIGSMGIKLHVNLKYTVGCLQIFNYNKQTLDYYIKNYFPLYFKLQKLLIGGYGIDFTDPIFQALCYQYQQKSQKGQKLQDYLIQLNQLLRNSQQTLNIFKHLWKISTIWPELQCNLWQPDNIILGVNDKHEIDKQKDLFLVFSTQGKEISVPSSPNINRSLPITQRSMSEQPQNSKIAGDSKISRHFLYQCDLPNIFFDEIALIRHKYQLREAMIQIQQKRTIFWQLDNNFSQKSLSWVLGTINIISLLLTLLSFFFVIFLIVSGQKVLLYAFVPYFVLFPFSEFLMVFLDFSLLISKGAKVFSFALYFTIFSAIKMFLVTIIQLVITISHGFDDLILIFLFVVWLLMVIFNAFGLVLLSMLHVHYVKNR